VTKPEARWHRRRNAAPDPGACTEQASAAGPKVIRRPILHHWNMQVRVSEGGEDDAQAGYWERWISFFEFSLAAGGRYIPTRSDIGDEITTSRRASMPSNDHGSSLTEAASAQPPPSTFTFYYDGKWILIQQTKYEKITTN